MFEEFLNQNSDAIIVILSLILALIIVTLIIIKIKNVISRKFVNEMKRDRNSHISFSENGKNSVTNLKTSHLANTNRSSFNNRIHDELKTLIERGFKNGDSYFKQKDYKNAIRIYLETLDNIGNRVNKNVLGSLLNRIGMCYKKIQEYDKALEYYNRSFELAQEMNNDHNAAVALLNIGYLYLFKNDCVNAYELFTRVEQINSKLQDKDLKHGLNEGYHYLEQKM